MDQHQLIDSEVSRAHADVSRLESELAMKQTELEQLYRVLAMYSQAGGAPPKDVEVMSLESNLRDMNQKYGDAVAEVSRLQQQVGMLQKMPGPGNGTSSADAEELRRAQDDVRRLQAEVERERERTNDANELAAQWQAAAEEAAAEAAIGRKQDIAVDTRGLEHRIKSLEAALEEKDRTHHAALAAASEAEKHARKRVSHLEEAVEELKSRPDTSDKVAELEGQIEELNQELTRREHDKAALTETFSQVEDAARERIQSLEEELKRRALLHEQQQSEHVSTLEERLAEAQGRMKKLESDLKKKTAEAEKLPTVRVAAAEAEKRARDAEHRARDAQEKMERAIAELEEAVQAHGHAQNLQAELDARQTRIEELECHLEEHKNDLHALEKSTEEQHAELEERLTRTSRELEAATRERDTHQGRVTVLETQVSDMDALRLEAAEHARRVVDMEERLASQDRVRQRLEDDLEAQDQSWQQKVDALEEAQARLTGELEALREAREELEAVRGSRAELEEQLGALKASKQSLEEELETLRSANAGHSDDVVAARQEVETLRRELEEARQHAARVEELEGEKKALSEKAEALVALEAEKASLAGEKASLEAEKARLQATVKDLEESLDDTVKEYDSRIAEQTEENDQALEELQAALQEQEQAHQEAQAEFEARLKAQARAHEEALAEAESKHGASSDEAKTLQAEIKKLKQALESKADALEQAQAEVEELQSDTEMLNAQFKGRIETLEKERAGRVEELTAAQAKATTLQSEVARLSTQAEQALAQVSKLERQLNEQAANPDDAKRFAELEDEARGLRERLLEAEQGSDKVVQESQDLKRRLENQEADVERLTIERDELRDQVRKEREVLERRLEELDADLERLALERDEAREQAGQVAALQKERDDLKRRLHASQVDAAIYARVEELELEVERITLERDELRKQPPPAPPVDDTALRQELDSAHAALIVERERREEAETKLEELRHAAQQVSDNLEKGAGWQPTPAKPRGRVSSAGVSLVPAGVPDGVCFLMRNILSRTHASADDMLELGRRWARLHTGTLKDSFSDFEAEGLGNIQMLGWNSEQNAFDLQCRNLFIFNANFLTGVLDESLLRLTGQGCTYQQTTSLTQQPTVTIFVRTSEAARAAVEQALREAGS